MQPIIWLRGISRISAFAKTITGTNFSEIVSARAPKEVKNRPLNKWSHTNLGLKQPKIPVNASKSKLMSVCIM
jgi:hypothetical protein